MTDYPTNSQGRKDAFRQNEYHLIFAMKDLFSSVWTYRAIRIILGAVFIWSGAVKLVNPFSFTVIIEAFGLIPEGWIMPAAVILPALEIVAGFALMLDINGSLAVVATMLAMFMLILVYGIWLGLDIDCGCFGPQDPEAEAFHGLRPSLYRDMVMIFGVVYLYAWRYYCSFEPDSLVVFFNSLIRKGGIY